MIASSRFDRTITVHVPLLLVLFFLLAPFYWMLIASLKPNAELYSPGSNPMFVLAPSLEHYQHLLTATEFPSSTKNTMLISVVSTFLSLLFAQTSGLRASAVAFPRRCLYRTGCIRDVRGAHVTPSHSDAPGRQDATPARQRLVTGADLRRF